MDCKRALGEAGGDLEAAVDWLRKKGLAAAAKKAGRVAAEGLVGVKVEGRAGAIVEVNTETDFVARNEVFQGFVRDVAALAVAGTGADAIAGLNEAVLPGTGRTVAAELTDLIARIGENMVVRRVERLAVGEGVVAAYVHNALGAGIGKIGVLVALESSADPEALHALGKQLAMHVAAAKPLYLDIAAVPPAALERERDILREQARDSGKAEAIIEKMVEGRLRKYYEEFVLLEQAFVIDPESRVAAVVAAAAKDARAPIRLAGFVRFALGEGIERPPSDFAAEVAQLKS
jgi:elongation factor Ts